MSNERLIFLCGLHSLGFALFHLGFWKLFDWKHELRKIGPPTRAIVQILNLRLIYVFAGIAAICFVFPSQLHATPLGRALLLFMSLFWLGRVVEQFVFLRLNHPLVHVLTALFVLGMVLFALPLL